MNEVSTTERPDTSDVSAPRIASIDAVDLYVTLEDKHAVWITRFHDRDAIAESLGHSKPVDDDRTLVVVDRGSFDETLTTVHLDADDDGLAVVEQAIEALTVAREAFLRAQANVRQHELNALKIGYELGRSGKPITFADSV